MQFFFRKTETWTFRICIFNVLAAWSARALPPYTAQWTQECGQVLRLEKDLQIWHSWLHLIFLVQTSRKFLCRGKSQSRTKRVLFRHDSRMEFKAEIERVEGSWSGRAVIPVDQFPPNVTRFNAFAAHTESGEDKKVWVSWSSNFSPSFILCQVDCTLSHQRGEGRRAPAGIVPANRFQLPLSQQCQSQLFQGVARHRTCRSSWKTKTKATET